MLQLNTIAEGHFTVYIPDELGELQMVADTKNLITDRGLDLVASRPWAECFTIALAGSGVTVEAFSDTAMEYLVLSALSGDQPANPSSYTLPYFNVVTGSTYNLGRTFKLLNTKTVPVTITELGTGNDSAIPYGLFSRALITPFTLAPNKFAYIIYELRLTTGVSTTTQPFAVDTDGTTGFSLPLDSKIGIINCPFATVTNTGAVAGSTASFSAGASMFEPSNPSYYLYKMTAPSTAGSAAYFNDRRAWYETRLLDQINGGTVAAPTFSTYKALSWVFTNEDTYVPGSYKRSRHFLASPDTPATGESIYGFVITNKPTAGLNLDKVGMHCVYLSGGTANAPWKVPGDAFFKLYFEQNWGRS